MNEWMEKKEKSKEKKKRYAQNYQIDHIIVNVVEVEIIIVDVRN